jgi:hypothetical protein
MSRPERARSPEPTTSREACNGQAAYQLGDQWMGQINVAAAKSQIAS